VAFIAALLPSGNLSCQRFFVWDAAVQALRGEHPSSDSAILSQLPCLAWNATLSGLRGTLSLRGKGFVKRRLVVGVPDYPAPDGSSYAFKRANNMNRLAVPLRSYS